MGERAEAWFARRGWQAFAFQREVWGAMAAGASGLLHANTGAGKTYAVAFGAIERIESAGGRGTPTLSVLGNTPMRGLGAGTLRQSRESMRHSITSVHSSAT